VPVLVTGATGHVGVNLVRALLEAGRPVRALLHRAGRPLEGLAVERVEGDVRDAAAVDRAVAGAEVVFHLAARISIGGDDPAEVRSVNVDGARLVAEACLRHGVRRLVHFASIHALADAPRGGPVDETRPAPGPEAPVYDRTKAEGLAAVEAAVGRGLDAVSVLPTAVVGPEDHGPSRMGQVLLDLHHRRLPALVGGGFDWVDVRDVVAGAMAAELRGVRGARYLLSGHWRSVEDLARLVERATGAAPPRFVCPMPVARAAAPFALAFARLTGRRPLFTPEALHALRHHRDVRRGRAAAALGWAPRPLEETVRDTLAWFGERGMLARR